MTEELKKKAEEYALEKCKECYMCNSEENGERGYCPKYESRIEGYLAGAEPREKRIAELEEKLANADYQLEGRDNEIAELKKTYRKQRNKRIDELQKENAELKADNAEWEKASDKWKKVYELTNNQLIKAKEILRSLYFIIQSRIDYKNNIGIADEMWRAEQFISEVEK